MRKKCSFLFCILFTFLTGHAESIEYTKGLSIWFDTPNTLEGQAIWHGRKSDTSWESQSLPIGNGSIGANILGSVEAERITFNEKTLWRGGPNTAKGADYYWNVNKQSAHILDEIRKAFIEGDQQKAEKLTRENFNSEVPYEYSGEKPFRFGNFTTMGEFYIETGLNTVKMSEIGRASCRERV